MRNRGGRCDRRARRRGRRGHPSVDDLCLTHWERPRPGHAREPLKSLTAAQQLARADAATKDVTVELEGGTYPFSTPLTLTAADSGTSGHPIVWSAAPGATPVVSGGTGVQGWSLFDRSTNIYVANVPVGQDSRQLYINGAAAPRAAITIPRSAVTATADGLHDQ